jgi:hypothetical protein
MNQSSKKVVKPTKNVSSNKNRNVASSKRRNNNPIRITSPGNAPQAFRPRGKFPISPPLVAVAAAYAKGQRSSAPRIEATRDQVRIVHRELVGSVTGSTAFTILQTIALNPGLSASFPWLATQAQAWERYRFNRLRFCYYTRTGSNIPGSVMLIPDYDAADAAPVSEQVASSYEDVEEDAPWKDIECDLRPSSLHAIGPSKFIRVGALLANQDIKTYDAGNFFLATVDGTAVSWGKLWVEYDITLMTPQLNPAGGGAIAAQGVFSATPTTASMLQTPTIAPNSSSIVSIAGDVLTFQQAGQYSLWYVVSGTTATQTGVPVAGAGGVIVYQEVSGSGTAAMTQVMQMTAVVGSTITFNNTLVACTNAVLLVSQIPSNLGAVNL